MAATQYPGFSATRRQTPPAWALQQRQVIALMNRTATFFAERYTRPDGTLKWREKWAGMDGTDNGYEIFIPYPLFYILGGGDHVRALAQIRNGMRLPGSSPSTGPSSGSSSLTSTGSITPRVIPTCSIWRWPTRSTTSTAPAPSTSPPCTPAMIRWRRTGIPSTS